MIARDRRARIVVVALCLSVGMSACARAPRTQPSLAACPAAAVDTRAWQTIQDSAAVRFRLPLEFVEQPRESGARRWWLGGDFQQYVLAGFIESTMPLAALDRAPGVGMDEMSVCVDNIAGREVLVQAWRTINGTFRNGRREDRYDVFAVVAVNPFLRFYLSSGGHERKTQALALAAVRTISVAADSSR